MIHRIKKLTALVIALSMLLVCFAFVNASAEETITMGATVHLSSNVEKKGVNVGKAFDATVSLDFDEDFIYAAGGLLVVKLGITYDPNVLEPVDPTTNEVIEFGDDGKPVSGTLYTYGDIADNPSRMSMLRRSDGRTIEAYYTASASTDADNIWTSGNFFTLSFRPKKDVAVVNSGITSIGIKDAYAGGLNKVDIQVEKSNASVTYNPPYTFNVYDSNIEIGEYLTVLGVKLIAPEDSEYPFLITVTKDGEQVEESLEVPIDTVSYHYDYPIDDKYTAGSYIATASYGNTRIERSFVVAEKIETPEPDDNDDEEDTSGDTDSTINVTPKPGNTNTDTSNKTDNDKTDKVDNTDKTDTSNTTDKTDEVYKPQVKYPSDTTGHWADSNIKYVYENSLMNGYADGTFGPDNSITRAEFVTVMARLLGKTEDPVAAGKFSDAYDHWAKGYIGALAADGIVGGISENEFAPDENITREQIAVILARAFGLTVADTTDLYADDILISDWARGGVYSVTAAGYMQGSDNNFNPTASATRAEVATIIYRLHSK